MFGRIPLSWCFVVDDLGADASFTIASHKLIIPSSINGVILVNTLSQENTNGVNTHIYNGFLNTRVAQTVGVSR